MTAWVALALILQTPKSDDGALGLADIPAYRSALNADPAAPATPVGFRDLWDHPETYRGKRVRIEGRVERVFHQSKVGELPALAEAWVTSTSRDPICLVFPDAEIPLGAKVAFSGDFVKRLRYASGDTDRVAPLIVGPARPTVVTTSSPPSSSGRDPILDTMFGLIVGLIVLVGVARTFLRRPIARRLRHSRSDLDPPPVFEDGVPE